MQKGVAQCVTPFFFSRLSYLILWGGFALALLRRNGGDYPGLRSRRDRCPEDIAFVNRGHSPQRCRHPAIPIEAATDMNLDFHYRYSPNLNSNLVASHGFLYNWTAVTRDKFATSTLNPSGIQGICPTGWHVPSDAEWTELTDYLSGNSQYRPNI